MHQGKRVVVARQAEPHQRHVVRGDAVARAVLLEEPSVHVARVLHDLLKGKGYTIDGAKRHLKKALKEHRQAEALRQRLEAIRAELLRLADDVERQA